MGSAASFNYPEGIAIDSNGTLYVADAGNNRIRKISVLGNATTLAGSGDYGFADGVESAAMFKAPNGVAVDSYGTVYVGDFGNRRIRVISQSGNVTTLAGSGSSGYVDGVGSAAYFGAGHLNLAVDSLGTVYVSDDRNHRIRKISPLGNVTTLAGSGTSAFLDGVGTAASFYYPYGIAVDSNGAVYIGDTWNHRIRKVSPLGNVTTLAGSGNGEFADGVGSAASFQNPNGVAIDSNGTLYIGDAWNNRIRKITRTA